MLKVTYAVTNLALTRKLISGKKKLIFFYKVVLDIIFEIVRSTFIPESKSIFFSIH